MTTIVTILTERYADWECALTMAAGRTYYGMNVRTATPGGKPVTSAGGLRITPDMAIADIDPETLDVLLINGGSTWESDEAPKIGALLKSVAEKGKIIGAICAATRPLAATGLLNECAHTSNAAGFLDDVPGYAGAAHYVDQPHALRTGGIITAAGTAPVSFMKTIMEAVGCGGTELDFYTGLHAAEHRQAA